MNDEVDASNDSDKGDDMDEFYGMKNVIFIFYSFIHPTTDWLYVSRHCKWRR